MDLSAQIYGNNGPTKLAPSSSESLDDSVWKARVHPRTHWFLVIFHLTNNAVHGGICLIVRHTHIILDLLSRWCVLILCLFSQWIEVCVLTFSGLPDQHKSWLAASDAERAHRRVGTHVGILTIFKRSKGRARGPARCPENEDWTGDFMDEHVDSMYGYFMGWDVIWGIMISFNDSLEGKNTYIAGDFVWVRLVTDVNGRIGE